VEMEMDVRFRRGSRRLAWRSEMRQPRGICPVSSEWTYIPLSTFGTTAIRVRWNPFSPLRVTCLRSP
jgi:hypothetical protein